MFSIGRCGGGVRRWSTVLVVCLLVTPLVPPSAQTASASHGDPLPLAVLGDDSFRADFSDALVRGVGVRFVHEGSGLYVDMRLKGYPPVPPIVRGQTAEFRVAPGVRVHYVVEENTVKELIELDQPHPSEFRFRLRAPGLDVHRRADRLYLGSAERPQLFFISPAVAWDANGADVPAELTLEGDELVIRVDEEALGTAAMPVTVDPTIEGIPSGATLEPYARKLFKMWDGRLVFFYFREEGWSGRQLAYRISEDGGDTWSVEETVGEVASLHQLSVTQAADGVFLVTFYEYDSSDRTRDVLLYSASPTPSGLEFGPRRVVAAGIDGGIPTPTVADRGVGPLGRRLAVGFVRADGLTDRREYVVSFSENGGATWGAPSTCRLSLVGEFFEGVVVAQGDRLHCLTSRWQEPLSWSEWNGVAWGPRTSIGVGVHALWLPSTVVTDDGALHLVVEEDYRQHVYSHASLPANGVVWATDVGVGTGAAPVLSTVGTSLHVFAEHEVFAQESLIRPLVASDGKTWHEGVPLGGRTFDHVLDYNEGWEFRTRQQDLVFALTDAEGTVGNRTGLATVPHRLDEADRRVSLSFVAPHTQTVDFLRLWIGAVDAPTYRIGLQTDAGGAPSGEWVDELRGPGGLVIAGAFRDVALGSKSSQASTTVELPETLLEGGSRYHVVVEPQPGPLEDPPSSSRWAEVDAVEVEPGTEDDFRVLDFAGSWSVAPAEIPLMLLWRSGGDVLVRQTVRPTGFERATEYRVPGQSFVAPRELSPLEARVYLRAVGEPDAEVTLRLLDAGEQELWSSTGAPPGNGWFALPVSGVTLSEGERYMLLVDSPNRDLDNHWRVSASGDPLDPEASWGGAEAFIVYATDRPGFNDRTAEAASEEWAVSPTIRLFNSSAEDALYLGDEERFDFATLLRHSGWGAEADPGHTLSFDYAYWNGGGWAPLSLERETMGDPFQNEEIAFDPPADWTTTEVDGRDAYWVRITSPEDPPKSVVPRRITSIRKFRHPTAAPWGEETIPLAWSQETEPVGVGFVAYDATPPEVVETDPMPLGNLLELDEISITWASASLFQDHLMRIEIDGTTLPVAVDGGLVTADVDSLESGIRSVSMEAVDSAGNFATHALEFTIAELSDSPGAATLREQTVPVNAGDAGSETTVTFESPIVDVEGFTEELNASTWVGYGEVFRAFALGATEVTFTNEEGSETTTVPISDAEVSYSLAAIARSDEPLIAEIAAQEVALPDVVVDVPSEFETANATAALRQTSAALGPGRSNTKYLMGNSMPTGVPLPLRGFAQSTQVLVSEIDGGVAVSAPENSASSRLAVEGQQTGLEPNVFRNHPFSGSDVPHAPLIACDGSKDDDSCLTPGPHGSYLSRTNSDFTYGSDSGVEVYATQWMFRDVETQPYLVWQQLSSFVETRACVSSLQLTPRLLNVVTEAAQVFQGIEEPDEWHLSYYAFMPPDGGDPMDEEDPDQVLREASLDWRNHSILNNGRVNKEADIRSGSGSNGAEVIWEWPVSQGLENTTEHLMLGAGWEVPDQGSGEIIQIESAHHWEVTLQYEEC